MGMFDSITCDYKLPLEKISQYHELNSFDFQKGDYQTKDLDCWLSNYTIREDGTLWIRKSEGKWVEGDQNAKCWIDRLGHMETTSSWDEQVLATETIVFYTGIQDDKNVNDYWIDFKAEFNKGQLQSLECIEVKATNNEARKDNHRLIMEKMKREKELFSKPLIKYLYVPYTRVIRFAFRQISKINWWKIERFLTPL